MNSQVTLKAENSKRELKIIVSAEKLDQYLKEAFKALAHELEVSGFRKGFVPEEIATKHISEEKIFSEALEIAVAREGSSALKDFAEDFVGKPQVKVLKAQKGNPLEILLMFEVLPQVFIDDWKSTKIVRKSVEVKREEVESSLEQLRKSRAKFRAVLRPAQNSDLVDVDFNVSVDGVVIEGGQAKRYPFILGEGRFLPGFEDAILGMSAGEEKKVRLVFPQNWRQKEHAGKEGDFDIKLNNVQERLLPDLNDDFAKSLGRFENLGKLNESIELGLKEEKNAEESIRVRREAVELLAQRIKDSDIPKVLFEQEIARLREELKLSVENQGVDFNDYLISIGKSENSLGQDFTETALRRIKSALILRTIAKKEVVLADPKEVEQRVQKEVEFLSRAQEDFKEKLDLEALYTYNENAVRNEKTLELIESVVTQKR